MRVATQRQAQIAFKKLWVLRGKPTLRAIKPITAWTLATGVTYDKMQDSFVDGNDDVVLVDWRVQPYLPLAFLPSDQPDSVAFALPGMITSATTSVLLLWTQEAHAALKAAWGISVNDVLYRITKIDPHPFGVTTPITIRVELEESKQTT